MKVTHKFAGKHNGEIKTLCKVHNYTWAFVSTTRWFKVTCKKCLKKRPVKKSTGYIITV